MTEATNWLIQVALLLMMLLSVGALVFILGSVLLIAIGWSVGHWRRR